MSEPNLEGVAPALVAFCRRNGLKITCGKNGHHNLGSKHYRGEALDFSARHLISGAPLSAEYVAHLYRDASASGLLIRDERTRPPGQKVWGGPHFHVEVA
jgi:hypothetical protein